MAKAKSGRVRIKGATDADKQQIAAARAANRAEANTKSGDAAPEAAPTAREAREAAQKLFDKADEAGKADIIAQNRMSLAVRGF